MTIEEIDLYRLKAENLVTYLPEGDSSACGAKSWAEYAQMLIDKKAKASECAKLDKRLAEIIDAVMALDVRLPESDPMQQKVAEGLVELNSPDEGAPVLLTGNSIVTHRMLRLIFDATRVPAFVVPVDTNGLTTDNAVAAGAFTPMAVMRAITDSGIAARSSSRHMIIPGLAHASKSGIERITRWTVDVGPISGFELPMYLVKER